MDRAADKGEAQWRELEAQQRRGRLERLQRRPLDLGRLIAAEANVAQVQHSGEHAPRLPLLVLLEPHVPQRLAHLR